VPGTHSARPSNKGPMRRSSTRHDRNQSEHGSLRPRYFRAGGLVCGRSFETNVQNSLHFPQVLITDLAGPQEQHQ
jgi:hypothetical protein